MKTQLLLVLAGLVLSVSLTAQDTAFRVMFYNVENLFDTIDAPDKDDAEFLPTSVLKHNTSNYNLKLNQISKVVNAAFGSEIPDILGLCEVENRQVVEDLVSHFDRAKSMKVIHEESLDERGIDNAIVFNSKKLKLIEHGVQLVEMPGERPTRYILWAHFKAKGSDKPITVFVNHWPSRSGGEEKSEWKRLAAAGALKTIIYDLRQKFPESYEIAMGDFNDYPTNKSTKDIENCIFPESPCMKNMHAYLQGSGKGSHAYQGEWGMLDQMFVNKALYKKSGQLYVEPNSGQIISFDWMLYESNYDKKLYPSRFYGKDKCFGGYSDHLPVSLIILKQ